MWNRTKYIEGLFAKSLYETLTGREQRQLDKAIAADEALAELAARLKAMVDRLPADSEMKAPDLLPELRVAVASADQEPALRWRARRTVQAAALALGLLGAFAIWHASYSWGPVETRQVAQAPALSLMQQALRKSEAYVAERKSADAIYLLHTALRAQPADPDAAQAQLMLADLSYDEQLYGPALDAYTAVQSNYAGFVQAQDEVVRIRIADRTELLDECRADDFETLFAYHAALRAGDDRFERLENVAARAAADPHGLLAERIVWSMAETLNQPGALADADARVAALQQVRDRSTNPIVQARASFEAGRAYEVEVGDRERAAQSYRLAGRHAAYKEAAATALARLSAQ